MIYLPLIPQKERKQCVQFLQKTFGESPWQLKRWRRGQIDGIDFEIAQISRGNTALCVAYCFAAPHKKLLYRYQNLQLLQKKSFSEGAFQTPLPLYYTPHVLLRTPAAGKNLWQETLKNKNALSQNIERVALWLAKLHSIKIKKYPFNVLGADQNLLDSYIHSLKKIHLWDPSVHALRDTLLKIQSGAPAAFVHNDFHLENIFFDKNAITVIDFDSSGKGDPLMDVGYFIAQLRFRTLIQNSLLRLQTFSRLINRFLEVYRSSRKLTRRETKRLVWYQARSDLRLAGFLARFVIPRMKATEKQKTINEAKILVQSIKEGVRMNI